jgi:hypothetical protein
VQRDRQGRWLFPSLNQEIGAARQAGKVVIPIIEKGVDPARITFLQGLEYDVLDREDVGATIIRLTGRLGALKVGSERARWAIAAVLGGLFLWANTSSDDDDDDDWEDEEWDDEEWGERR